MKLSTHGVTSPDQLGDNFPLPGRYHAAIKHWDEAKNPMEVEFEILAGTVPGQAGKTLRQLFGTDTDWKMERLTRLAMCIGLIGGNEQREVSFRQAIGKQLILEVEKSISKKDGRTYHNVTTQGLLPIGHPDAKDIPLDREMLKMHQAGGSTTSAATPTPATPAGQAAIAVAGVPASATQGWNDL